MIKKTNITNKTAITPKSSLLSLPFFPFISISFFFYHLFLRMYNCVCVCVFHWLSEKADSEIVGEPFRLEVPDKQRHTDSPFSNIISPSSGLSHVFLQCVSCFTCGWYYSFERIDLVPDPQISLASGLRCSHEILIAKKYFMVMMYHRDLNWALCCFTL